MKGNKKAIALFVFALIFVVATLFLLSFQAALTVGFYTSTFGSGESSASNLGEAIGEIFATIFGVLFLIIFIGIFGLGTIISGSLILPFDIILIKKHGVKTWYTRAIWIFAVVAISLAILLFVSILVSGGISSAVNNSSSSSSSSSM